MSELLTAFPSEVTHKIDANSVRDEKIWNLTLLGYSKTRIGKELGLSRGTVAMVVNSDYGQRHLSEMFETVEQAMFGLPEVVGIATNQLKKVLAGEYSYQKSRTIIEAAKLAFGVVAKFKELDREIDCRQV